MELSSLFDASVDYSAESDWEMQLPTGGGVYLLADEADRMIQLATTADLKRALRHRLGREEVPGTATGPDSPDASRETTADTGPESPAPPGVTPRPSRPRINLREVVRRIWWRPAWSQFELTFEYYRLARVLMPQSYRRQLAFGPSWFVHVDPAAHTPQFTPGKFLRSPPGVDLGPLATQADASRFIEILQDAFELCRYHHILEQAPHGQACAYFEMGKCPAPCDGTIPLSTYRDTIHSALAFACGERAPTWERLQLAMQEAAARQAYERAGLLKRQLERARGIEHAVFSRVRPIEQFNYLVVQRGRGTTRLRPFFVRQGTITPGDEIKRSELPQAVESWIQQIRQTPEPVPVDVRSEQIWLVNHFLFKPDAPGAYLHASELSDPSRVGSMLEDRFAGQVRATDQSSIPQ
jgi:excinuclease UvrABC nuclease subunit